MRKVSAKRKAFLIRKQRKKQRRERLASGRRKCAKHSTPRRQREIQRQLMQDQLARVECISSIYNRKSYDGDPLSVDIKGELGIEDDKSFDTFIELAGILVDAHSRKLEIDLHNCTRVWPSGITLLCSLSQWIELTSHPKKRPKILSTKSESDEVNSYLFQSGFYDYVGRKPDPMKTAYSPEATVRIHREMLDRDPEKAMEHREDEIVNLLKKHSVLDESGIEEFNDVVLTEILMNVHEHGMPKRDRGWWLMAQHHHIHKYISLCIADNGIGFKNSLLSGPQRAQIGDELGKKIESEGHLIKFAFDENVSGSLSAYPKEGAIIRKYKRGARKGNGLKRIQTVCGRLKIPLTVLSHHGYIQFDDAGEIRRHDTLQRRVFAGTMYHMLIPAS